jgi:hypothetical protein
VVQYYSAEFKNNLVKKMTVPPARSATTLAEKVREVLDAELQEEIR